MDARAEAQLRFAGWLRLLMKNVEADDGVWRVTVAAMNDDLSRHGLEPVTEAEVQALMRAQRAAYLKGIEH